MAQGCARACARWRTAAHECARLRTVAQNYASPSSGVARLVHGRRQRPTLRLSGDLLPFRGLIDTADPYSVTLYDQLPKHDHCTSAGPISPPPSPPTQTARFVRAPEPSHRPSATPLQRTPPAVADSARPIPSTPSRERCAVPRSLSPAMPVTPRVRARRRLGSACRAVWLCEPP